MSALTEQRVALKARIEDLERNVAEAQAELDALSAQKEAPAPAGTPLFERIRSSVPSWFPFALTTFIYVLGVVIRYLYVVVWHDPRKFVYSDMRMYVDLARRLSQPGYVVNMGDITHPPGNTWILEYFYQHYPTPGAPDGISPHAVYFYFAITALVPLAMGALGWVAFGRTSALAAISIASFDFEFINFGGFFLAETHLTFFATICIAAYLLAMKLAAKPASAKRTLGLVAAAIVGGLCFSIAMTLKMVAMPAILGFVAVHFLFAKKPPWVMRTVVAAIFCLSAVPITGKMVSRCTTANEGHFCTGSNKSAADFFLGHDGRIQGIEWHDPKSRGVVGFGNPSAYQHGYRNKDVVNFAITDQQKNNEAAWKWIRQNPYESVVLSFEHVWDSFGGAYCWPPAATADWSASYTFHFLFLVFLLFPAMMRLVAVLRQNGVIGLLRSDEFIVLSPIFGVCLAVFVATGEVRYRIPWDGVFIVLAVEFYRRFPIKFWEPKPVVVPAKAEAVALSEAPAPGADEPEKSVASDEVASVDDEKAVPVE